MTRWLILGALLGLLLLCPSLLAVVAAIVTAILSKPVIVAFGVGVAAGIKAPRPQRVSR